jgi:hypothetical protein
MSFKPLVKLACAAGIAATAVLGLATPPAHATNQCGMVTYYFAGGGRCLEFCGPDDDITCFGNTTGDPTRTVGVCTC